MGTSCLIGYKYNNKKFYIYNPNDSDNLEEILIQDLINILERYDYKTIIKNFEDVKIKKKEDDNFYTGYTNIDELMFYDYIIDEGSDVYADYEFIYDFDNKKFIDNINETQFNKLEEKLNSLYKK